jgi:hypothetical protein
MISAARGVCQDEPPHPIHPYPEKIDPYKYQRPKTNDENPAIHPNEYQHVKIVPTPDVIGPEPPEPPDEGEWCYTHSQECDYAWRQQIYCEKHKVYCAEHQKEMLQGQFVVPLR